MVFKPIYILILFFTIVIDYFAGIYIDKNEGKKRKLFLVLSLAANIFVLLVFKYYNFLVDNLNSIVPEANKLPLLSILLPVGLSFHTFQAMSYTIEVYRKNYKPERHFGYYALYVMYFPQLVAGPIERPHNILYQFKEKHRLKYENFSIGIKLILYGLFKKVVIADNISTIVDSYYGNLPSTVNSTLAVFLFSIQIYCDFSGYSDIAIGSSKLMGINLMKNFNFPYFSKSISEFWSRWHISLSTWFKDYLYIPLGGNRVNKVFHYRNIFIVFAVSGLWHGAAWTFICWGALYGLLLIAEDFFQLKKMQFVSVLLTFSIVSVLWIFFRAQDFSTAFVVFNNLFSDNFVGVNISKHSLFYILLTLSFLAFEYYIRNSDIVDFFNRFPHTGRTVLTVGLIYTILLLGNFDKSQFIYFQF